MIHRKQVCILKLMIHMLLSHKGIWFFWTIINDLRILSKVWKNFFNWLLFFFRENHFTDPYILPNVPKIELSNPTKVLQDAMEVVRKDRTVYRAKFIPIDELYTEEERLELYKEFAAACDENRLISVIGLRAILVNMDF